MINIDIAFEGERIQDKSRIVAREFKGEDRPDLHAGTLPLEGLTARLSLAANQWRTVGIMHIDVLERLLVEDQTKENDAESDGSERPCTAHETPQAMRTAIGRIISSNGNTNWDSSKNLFRHRE